MTDELDDRDPERGEAFRALVERAMEAEGIPSVVALAKATGISKASWYNWFAGQRPGRNSLRHAVHPLGLKLSQLMEPWETGQPVYVLAPQDIGDLVDATDRMTAAIEAQTEMLRSVLALLGQRSVDPTVAGPLERWGHALAASWPQFQEPVPTLTESGRE